MVTIHVYAPSLVSEQYRAYISISSNGLGKAGYAGWARGAMAYSTFHALLQIAIATFCFMSFLFSCIHFNASLHSWAQSDSS